MEKIYSSKSLWIFNGLHGVTSQKTELFITTAMRTTNPAMYSELVMNLRAGLNSRQEQGFLL
jgi:hypothetical protein